MGLEQFEERRLLSSGILGELAPLLPPPSFSPQGLIAQAVPAPAVVTAVLNGDGGKDAIAPPQNQPPTPVLNINLDTRSTDTNQGSVSNLLGSVPLLPNLDVSTTVAAGASLGVRVGLGLGNSGPAVQGNASATGGIVLTLGNNPAAGTGSGASLGVSLGGLLDAVVSVGVGAGNGSTEGGGGGSGGNTGSGGSGSGIVTVTGGTGTTSAGTQGSIGIGLTVGQGSTVDAGLGVSVGGNKDSGSGNTPPSGENGTGSQTDPGGQPVAGQHGDGQPDPGATSPEMSTDTNAGSQDNGSHPAAGDNGDPSPGLLGLPDALVTQGTDPQTADAFLAGVAVPLDRVPADGLGETAALPLGVPNFDGQPQQLLALDGGGLKANQDGMFDVGAAAWEADPGVAGLPADGVPKIGPVVVQDAPPDPATPPEETVDLGQGADLLDRFAPFDPKALEAGLQLFLDRLSAAGRQLVSLPLSSWLLAGAALAVAGEMLRRRRRSQSDLVLADDLEETLRWFPDLGPMEEDA